MQKFSDSQLPQNYSHSSASANCSMPSSPPFQLHNKVRVSMDNSSTNSTESTHSSAGGQRIRRVVDINLQLPTPEYAKGSPVMPKRQPEDPMLMALLRNAVKKKSTCLCMRPGDRQGPQRPQHERCETGRVIHPNTYFKQTEKDAYKEQKAKEAVSHPRLDPPIQQLWMATISHAMDSQILHLPPNFRQAFRPEWSSAISMFHNDPRLSDPHLKKFFFRQESLRTPNIQIFHYHCPAQNQDPTVCAKYGCSKRRQRHNHNKNTSMTDRPPLYVDNEADVEDTDGPSCFDDFDFFRPTSFEQLDEEGEGSSESSSVTRTPVDLNSLNAVIHTRSATMTSATIAENAKEDSLKQGSRSRSASRPMLWIAIVLGQAVLSSTTSSSHSLTYPMDRTLIPTTDQDENSRNNTLNYR
uniref:Uncharacterized protein n=1 Tax=Ditylenchus dipsaci TaxID=166011 RepID=A0A915DRF5_9BILA